MVNALREFGGRVFNAANETAERHPFVRIIQKIVKRYFPNRPLLTSKKPFPADHVSETKAPEDSALEQDFSNLETLSSRSGDISESLSIASSETPTGIASLTRTTRKQEPVKLFKSSFQWGKHSYTVTQYLPESTSEEEWNVIVENYKDILKDRQEEAGVAYLTLTLDRVKEKMLINIPERNKTISVEKGHRAVNALLNYYITREIDQARKEFQDSLAQKEKIASTEKEDAVAATETPRSHDLTPEAISQVAKKTLKIENKGNTCFIASACQAWLIYQKDALSRKCEDQKTTDAEKKTIKVLLDWIENYETTTKDEIDVAPLKDLLKKHKQDWFNKDGTLKQQDVADFMQWLSSFMIQQKVYSQKQYIFEDKALEEINKNGEQIVEVRSKELHTSSFIQVPLGKPIASAIITYLNDPVTKGLTVRRELLNPTTLSNRVADIPVKSIRTQFLQTPEELNLEFVRFNSKKEKLGTDIEVSENLELPAEYFADHKKKSYHLESVIVHRGTSPNDGHYVAYVRKYNADGSSYFVFANDGEITHVPIGKVLEDAKKGYIFRYRVADENDYYDII